MRWRRLLRRASERIIEAYRIDRVRTPFGRGAHGKARPFLTEQSQIAGAEAPTQAPAKVDRPYDMRRLSYAGTFTNPVKADTIRTIEWLTAKVQLLRLIRSFEKSGAPFGAPFWPKAIRHMGIRIDTPAEEIARIPATGPVVVVANHPHGLVDGMVMAEIVNRVRSDFKILTAVLADRHPRGRGIHDPGALPARGERPRTGPADA